MLDRTQQTEIDYQQSDINLLLSKRPTLHFLTLTIKIHDELTKEKKHIQSHSQGHTFLKSIPELGKEAQAIVDTEEKARETFILPTHYIERYQFALNRYNNMQSNPEAFFKKENDKRQLLIDEKNKLDADILEKETNLAKLEDEIREEINKKKERYLVEAGALKVKQEKYESRIKSKEQKCASCGMKKDQERLEHIKEERNKIKGKLKELSTNKDPRLNDKRDELKKMRDNRWDLDKNINDYDLSKQTDKWKRIVSNAKNVIFVYQYDIDNAVARFYGSLSEKAISSLYKLYIAILSCADTMVEKSEELKTDLAELRGLAAKLYCEALNHRTIETLYQKAIKHEQNPLDLIKGKRPTLIRTLSLTNIHATAILNESGAEKKESNQIAHFNGTEIERVEMTPRMKPV